MKKKIEDDPEIRRQLDEIGEKSSFPSLGEKTVMRKKTFDVTISEDGKYEFKETHEGGENE